MSERMDTPPAWLDDIDDRLIADVPIPSQPARPAIPMRPRSRPAEAGETAPRKPIEFTAITDDDFRLVDPNLGITFNLTRVRRDSWGSLIGELAVVCQLAGTRTMADGRLNAPAAFNCSKLRERREWAEMLAKRSRTGTSVDWASLLEELCARVMLAESTANPIVELRDIPTRTTDATAAIGRFVLLIDQPIIVFGDGGSAKSLLSLYVGGTLAQRGYRVLVLDYESEGSDWRARGVSMFPDGIPAGLYYQRGTRPLTTVANDLRRLIAELGIHYLIVDSVAVACDGPPENADVAQRYFQAIRRIGVGSLNIAHVTKSLDTAKSFGSAFWSNLARANWYVKPAEHDTPNQLTIALYHRKVNGPKYSAAGFHFDFSGGAIRVSSVDVASVEELAAGLPLRQRIRALLGANGKMTVDEIVTEIGNGVKVDSVTRTLRKYQQQFKRHTGIDGVARFYLEETRVSA